VVAAVLIAVLTACESVPNPKEDGTKELTVLFGTQGFNDLVYNDLVLKGVMSAHVYVNGHDAGTVFAAPFEIDITPYLHKGQNTLRIEVTSLAANYLDEDTNTLYAYQELAGDGGSQDLGATEICQRWWAYMADIMVTNPDHSPVSIPLPEMFHMD